MEEKPISQRIKLSRKLKFKTWLKYIQITIWKFKYSLIFTISVLLLGVFTHRYYNNLSYAESFYYTTTLLIGEHLIEPANTLEIIIFIILPFFGVTLILTIAANALLFLFTKSYRKADWLLTMAKLTNGHTVVVGYGHLGQKVIRELLKLEQEVVVIEKDEEKEEIQRLIEIGTIPVVIGNARYPEILMKANISQARAMILTSKHEGHNLEIALKAKKTNNNLKIVMRLFELDIGKLTETLGISTAFSTSSLSAPVFAMSSLMPEIKDAIVIKDNIFYFVELTVHENSSFSGHLLEELENECDVNIVTLKHDDDLMIRPDTDSTLISPDDTILMLGDFNSVKKAKQLLKPSKMK